MAPLGNIDFTFLELALAGLLATGVIMVFPHHIEIGWVLMVGSGLMMILVAVNQFWPGPMIALAGRFRPHVPEPAPDPFMSLAEAARELYEANIDTTLGNFARMDPGGGAEPLNWMAYWIAPRLAEVYGRRPPSTALERIPSSLLTHGRIDDDGRRLTGGDGGDYVDLAVKRDAFRAMIPALSGMGE